MMIADRNYKNLDFFFYSIQNNEKFSIRVASNIYKKEINKMKSDNGIINIGYEYNRVKYYKESSPNLYKYFSEGNTVDIRCVKIKINTNETEYLLTSLTKEEFSTAEMSNLYNLR